MSEENKTLTPVWIAYVDGKRLNTDYEGALKSITVMDLINGIGTARMLFDMSAVNFDEDEVFSLMSEVSIHLGYKDDVEEVFKGVVIHFAPRFDEYENPKMEVLISSQLFQLKKGLHSRTYLDKSPSDIIKEILSLYNLDCDVEDFGPTFPEIEQFNVTDYDYLKRLTETYGKSFYCYNNKVTVKTEITPSNDDVILEWGKSLISAETETNLKEQLSEVTCFGHNWQSDKDFKATAKMSDVPLRIGGSYNWEDNSKGYDPNKVHFINGGVDQADAKEIAAAFLMQSSFKFQTVRVKSEGNYKIKPGNRLTLKYLGEMFSGEYLIKFVMHTFDILTGYETECDLCRNYCETSLSKGHVSAIDNEMAQSRNNNSQDNAAASQTDDSESQEDETAEEEKNPQITNPRWEKDGQSITKALVGDEVILFADVTDIDDGKSATIKIVEKDDDGNDDEVTTLTAKVQNGKIECKWKVIYTEDDDDSNSQQEKEEKGYTLPEYVFTVECDGVESEESAQLDVRGGLKVQLKDKKTNNVLKNTKISLKQNDSIYKTLTTDDEGYFELMEIPIGEYEIILEN